MNIRHRATWKGRLAVLAASTILAGAFAAPSWADKDQDAKTTTPIKHLVVIFGENISFDHYFATYPNAANPAGEPRFKAADDTPTVNGLSDGLLTNNPNLRQPFRLDRTEAFTCDMDHGYTDEQKALDGGLMDLFVQAVGRSGFGCRPDGSSVMGYYDGNTVTAMWNYAQRFAMNDNSFDTMYGPSTPGALNLVSGQTGLVSLLTFQNGQLTSTTPGTDTGDTDPALDDCGRDLGGTVVNKTATMQSNSPNIGDLLNAQHITFWGWFEGGFAPTAPATLNPDGSTKTPAVCGQAHTISTNTPNPPTQDNNPTNIDIHKTPIPDYVAHHAPFMYYASTRNVHHVRPSSVAKIGFDDANTVDGSANGATFPVNHQYDISDFFAALKNGNLPSVSYLKAPAFEDAHPANSDPLDEQRFVVGVINALQQSPEWGETAVIILYDDSDGWYDHVMPPIVNQSVSSQDSLVPFNPAQPVNGVLPASATSPGQIATSGLCATPGATAASKTLDTRCGHGPRQPFLVISPFAKQNFVDHSQTDQTSVLTFIEANWGLGFVDGGPALPAGAPLGTASFDHVAGSVMNMFDFDNGPRMERLFLDDTTGEVVHN